MVRSPAVASPLPSVLKDRRHVLVDIDIDVVTPMFGGGATPRAADALLPIRGAAVRGHLRFWWRACHAHLFADAASLFAREADIWGEAGIAGSSRGPSAIEVEIEIPANGHGQADFPGTSEPRYALFPFLGEPEQNIPPAVGRRGVQFRLRLTAAPGLPPGRVSELRQAAETATAAWIAFGGVGARTRRGSGSLSCTKVRLPPLFAPFQPYAEEPQADEREQWIQVGQQVWLPRMAAGAPVASALKIPLVRQGRILAGAPMKIDEAWAAAVKLMQTFSQGPNVGRNPGYGRSRWPEPDSVRSRWPDLDPNPHHTPVHPARGSYPRADLRLPIGLQRLGAKPFPALQGSASAATRMASPVILKALPISDTQAMPLMLLLTAPHVWDPVAPGVEIASSFGTAQIAPGDLQMQSNALHPDPHRLMGSGNTIRDAFVAWAEKSWHRQAVSL